MAQSTGKALGVGLGVGALIFFLSRMAKGSTMERNIFAPRNLTEHFKLEEFLKGHPLMPRIGVTQAEFNNLTALAKVLEKVRPITGPIHVTNGLRPVDLTFPTNKGPMTLDQILIEKGYHPSATSDHHDGSGADLAFDTQAVYLPAMKALAAMPEVRQVILYLTSKTEGNVKSTVANHLHVSVRAGKAKIADPFYAYVNLDGKRVA